VTGVKAPVALNVWIVLPPDDVTKPPLNTCEPAYEMITIPEPPEADVDAHEPPPPPPVLAVPETAGEALVPAPPPPVPPVPGVPLLPPPPPPAYVTLEPDIEDAEPLPPF